MCFKYVFTLGYSLSVSDFQQSLCLFFIKLKIDYAHVQRCVYITCHFINKLANTSTSAVLNSEGCKSNIFQKKIFQLNIN